MMTAAIAAIRTTTADVSGLAAGGAAFGGVFAGAAGGRVVVLMEFTDVCQGVAGLSSRIFVPWKLRPAAA